MPEIQGNSIVDRLDGVNQGIAFKAPVRVATTGTDISPLTGLKTIDGIILLAGDRVLVKDQNDESINGIYNAFDGDWLRSLDANGNRDLMFGSCVFVNEGSINTRSAWCLTCQDNPIVIDQSLLTWVKWSGIGTSSSAIEFIVFNATTGVAGDAGVPWNCTINSVTLLADQVGSIQVDIWNKSYGGYPPTISNSICAAAIPTIASALSSQDATLTGWNTFLAQGTTIRYNVVSVSTITRCTIWLQVTKF